ncbi:hypothetical protein BDP27DRAFT_1405655 [Rhodocollybia butyracea]|uniref:Uncharacterized protein n=1 Tax=Rhodocollybia butyracea TaxID=206335 RepID=A0A9P5PI10_9AGAR|nr:hypothetical protein BDP27DRAFT_1405655 [Rhodocollybia butyracea]
MTINDPEGYPVAIALGIAVGALRLWVYVGAAGQALQFYMLGSSRALESSEVSQDLRYNEGHERSRTQEIKIRNTPQERTKEYRQGPILKHSVCSTSGEFPLVNQRGTRVRT